MSEPNKPVPASVKVFLAAGALLGATVAIVSNRDKIRDATACMYQMATDAFEEASNQRRAYTEDSESDDEVYEEDFSSTSGFRSEHSPKSKSRKGNVTPDSSLSTPSSSDSEETFADNPLELLALALD